MTCQASSGSTPHSCDTKTWPHSRKTPAQHTEQGQLLDGQRLHRLYELGARRPQPCALTQEPTSRKILITPEWSGAQYLVSTTVLNVQVKLYAT
jgi:hypothetical protein